MTYEILKYMMFVKDIAVKDHFDFAVTYVEFKSIYICSVLKMYLKKLLHFLSSFIVDNLPCDAHDSKKKRGYSVVMSLWATQHLWVE